MGCRQELEESGWSGSPPGMASRSLGRLKRSVIWTGIGKVFPLAWAEAGCRDRSRVFLWGGDGGGMAKGRTGPSAWSNQIPPSAFSKAGNTGLWKLHLQFGPHPLQAEAMAEECCLLPIQEPLKPRDARRKRQERKDEMGDLLTTSLSGEPGRDPGSPFLVGVLASFLGNWIFFKSSLS